MVIDVITVGENSQPLRFEHRKHCHRHPVEQAFWESQQRNKHHIIVNYGEPIVGTLNNMVDRVNGEVNTACKSPVEESGNEDEYKDVPR